MDRYYSQINTELVKTVVVDKFTREADTLAQRKKRERQRVLRETTNDLVSGFKVLSKVYFNKSKGEQLLSSDFQDIVSEFGVKDLVAHKKQILLEKQQAEATAGLSVVEFEEKPGRTVLPKVENRITGRANKSLPRAKVGAIEKYLHRPKSGISYVSNPGGEHGGSGTLEQTSHSNIAMAKNLSTSISVTRNSSRVNQSHRQSGGDGQSALSEIKSHLGELPTLIKSYQDCIKEVDTRKEETFRLQTQRTGQLVEIQQLRDEIVGFDLEGAYQGLLEIGSRQEDKWDYKCESSSRA